MTRYHPIDSTDDNEALDSSAPTHLQQPSSSPSTFFRRGSRLLPELNHAIRARASSLASELSIKAPFHNHNRTQNNTTGSNDFDEGLSSNPPMPLPVRSSSSSSSTSSRSSPNAVKINVGPSHDDDPDDQERGQGEPNSTSLRHISHRSNQVRFLRLLWCLSLAVGEHGTFWAMVHRCSWPENSAWDTTDQAMKDRYRIAVIADPQLTDWVSYRQEGLLLGLVQIYTDIYMKRSFRRMHSSLRPDAVIFVGDLNDGGRLSQGQVFEDNLQRFYQRVFESKSSAWNQAPVIMDEAPEDPLTEEGFAGHYKQVKDIPTTAAEREEVRSSGKSLRLYVAGNHDVGFGDNLIKTSLIRYKKMFGSVNYEIQVGNHSLVVLDTLSLSAVVPEIREESQQFLNQMEQEPLTLPRILFTHVPLFRSDTTYCGDVRETKQLIINRGGAQYWNMVSASLSREILRGIQPDMVFSGDDHDWCEIAHSLDGTITPEVTLRSFSFAQGIQQPAFVMLSLYNPDHTPKNTFPDVPGPGLPVGALDPADQTETVLRPTGKATFAYEECMLPNQMQIYICYGVLFGISLCWIVVQRYRWITSGGWARQQRHLKRRGVYMPVATTSSFSSISRSLFGDENEDGESVDREEDNRERRIFSAGKPTWPLLMPVYWKLVAWDLVNVAWFVIPFYFLLFVISIM
ncbi:ethanolamine phosphate phosphodiesterase [Entomortierella parvispora]|uniref:Ethanolamine phosphate phosphodiesterase n=1 Tax=Entomortierella parvispora TaxID=205924 RepID=A0A9P3HFK1_9FUNG|nr:ethanolamine phosphate phosphodiesterase [Entomortierella parvispora]